MKNRIVKFSLIVMLFIITIATNPHHTYADSALTQSNINIPSDWAKGEIDKAKEMNLLTEKVQGEYRRSITREEFSELAVNLYEVLSEKKGTIQEENPFIDTKNRKVLIANKLGIVNGKGDGEFAPNDTATREDISVMLYRTLQAAKPEYNYSYSQEYIFEDYDAISLWAQEAVGYLYGVEVINGVGDNIFNPKGVTTREEAIVLVKRMYEKVLLSEKNSTDNLIASRGGSRLRQESSLKSKLATLIPQELNKPYQWGGTGPNSYDCSGLVYSLYGKLEISLPRTSKDQSKVGVYVPKEDLIYGDLVFFASDGRNVSHVGIYVGNGEFVHAPQTGDVVKISTLMTGYYANKYYTARRVLP